MRLPLNPMMFTRFNIFCALLALVVTTAQAQDLNSVSVCLYPADGSSVHRAQVEFLDPALSDPVVLTDASGNPRRYVMTGGRCVTGAGVVGTEELPPVNVVTSIQSYPNPSHGMTTLRWSVEAPTTGQIRIVDLLGREVVRSAMTSLDPGQHEARLVGGGLSAGTYLVQVTSESGRIISTGSLISTGGGSGTTRVSIQPGIGDPFADDSEGVRFSAKSPGDVRVRVVAEGYLAREARFISVSDGDELHVGLENAPEIEVFPVDLTNHRESISSGEIVFRHRETGFQYAVPINNGAATGSVPDSDMDVWVTATGFSSVGAARIGAPRVYGQRLLGLNFGSQNDGAWIHVPGGFSGPITLGVLPQRMIDDGSWDTYVSTFSHRQASSGDWKAAPHFAFDLEDPAYREGTDSADPLHRISGVYRYDAWPSTNLFDSLMVAANTLASTVNGRSWYNLEYLPVTEQRHQGDIGIRLKEDEVGSGGYTTERDGASGQINQLRLSAPFAPLNYADWTNQTVPDMMTLLIMGMFTLDDSVDDTDTSFRSAYIDGWQYTTMVADFLAIQAFVGPVARGTSYNPDASGEGGSFVTGPFITY